MTHTGPLLPVATRTYTCPPVLDGGNPLWTELNEAKREIEQLRLERADLRKQVYATFIDRLALADYLTKIHALVARSGEHEGRPTEMAGCALSGVAGLSMELAELRSQLTTAQADRDVFRQELGLLNRRFVKAMTPGASA